MLGLKQVYPGRYVPETLLKLVRDEGVTFSHCVPTILHMLLVHPLSKVIDLSRWKLIIGGSALSQAQARAAMARSRRRRDAHRRVATTRAVEQGDAALHVRQLHPLGVGRRCGHAGDGLVPPLAYPFFHEPKSGS